MNIAAYIDHTLLKPTTLPTDIDRLCQEAIQYEFAAVCVPPTFVRKAKQMLIDTDVKVATVIGFPFGYADGAAKIAEINAAIADGADELDMVVNLIHVKQGDWEAISAEWSACLQPIRLHNKVLKIIIESSELTDEEIIHCCALANKHQVDFLKTSTGYASGGASVEAVSLMRTHLSDNIQIKASGGIRDAAFAQALIAAGATRIGASAGIAIVNGAIGTDSY